MILKAFLHGLKDDATSKVCITVIQDFWQCTSMLCLMAFSSWMALDPSFSSSSARLLPSSRACLRSRAVKAPPPVLWESLPPLEEPPQRQRPMVVSPPFAYFDLCSIPTIHSEQLGAIDVLSNVHILVIGTTAVGGIKTELKAHSHTFCCKVQSFTDGCIVISIRAPSLNFCLGCSYMRRCTCIRPKLSRRNFQPSIKSEGRCFVPECHRSGN